MSDFLTYLVNGISLGGIYALIALGFVVVFKATEVVNFAHGSFVVLGAYVIARGQDGAPWAVAVLAGIAATSGGFLLVERLFVRKLMHDQHGANALAILTIGGQTYKQTFRVENTAPAATSSPFGFGGEGKNK